MSFIEDTLFDLGRKSIRFWSENGKLKMKGPKSEITPELRNWIKEKKEDILAYLEMTHSGIAEEPIPAGDPLTQHPLSFGQSRMWFLSGVTKSTAYNMALALDLKGQLDPQLLDTAIQTVISRHHIFKTLFRDPDGIPFQIYDPNLVIKLGFQDLSQWREKRRRFELLQVMEKATSRSFDLSHGPLVDFLLLKLEPDSFRLLVVMHHIISDDWSLGILVRELTEVYAALKEGRAPQLNPCRIQYADFAAWERSQAVIQSRRRRMTYWINQLEGAHDFPALPTDRPYSPSIGSEGAGYTFTIPKEISAKLNHLCRSRGVTLFTMLCTAFAVFLSRYCREEELVIGTPIANRTREEVEDLVGFFVNTLALRIHMGRLGRPGFSEILEQVRRTVMEAFANQDVPFDQVVDALRLERQPNKNPLFRVFFILQNAHDETLKLPGLEITPVPIPVTTAKFDLTLAVSERAFGLECTFEYRTALFEDTTIQRAATHFQNLLSGVADEIERPIGRYQLMDADERQRLLVAWNKTPSPVEGGTHTLHQLVTHALAQNPDSIAIWDPVADKSLTRNQMLVASSRLAARIQQAGACPGDIIAVCMPRTPDLVVALLAVLRAGCTYLPLDPDYPHERLRFMLEDSEAKLLVVSETLPAPFPEHDRVVSVAMTDSRSEEGPPIEWREPEVCSTQPAYIIYTSGSTGKPKGVMVTHGAVVSFVQWALNHFSSKELAVVMASTSVCFDLSIFEMFAPLAAGETVAILENALALAELDPSSGITLINTVPSAMAELVHAECLPLSLRTLNLAGEPIPADLMRKLHKIRHIRTINNLYGPSEDTTYSTHAALTKSGEGRLIGKPIHGTQTYVLDPEGEPTPTGIPGELYLGGAGLASGYWRRPGLTAERFVPNPFADMPGERLYRTGDNVRYRCKGKTHDLEFLGRLDRQVKVRGFRIEPGELEHALSRHPLIESCCIDVRSSNQGAPLIVAYLVPKPMARNIVGSVRESLKKDFPVHMMPNSFLILDQMPLTPNGKIDRAALPDPTANHTDTQYTSPQTPTEEMLVEIWTEVLKVTPIGIHDNFFQLGGHSLLGPLVLSLIKKSFGVGLPFKSLFEAPTIAKLAELIAAGRSDSRVYPDIEPDLENRYKPFPLTDVQFAYWIGRSNDLELGQVATHVYQELSVKDLDVSRFQAAWQAVIDRHDMLRAVFNADGSQRILPAYQYQIPLADLRDRGADVVKDHIQVTREEMSHQVLPSDQPLFDIRLTLLNEHALVHTSFDALILDASSMRIVVADFAAYYKDPAVALPAVPFSFRDYVLAETAFRETQTYQESLNYWRGRFDTLPPGPDLPLRIHPGELDKPHFVSRQGELDPDQWRALKSRATQRGLTPAGALLAAFAEVLILWSKSPHFCINLTLFNRLPFHPKINETVGDFTSLTMLEVDGSKGASLAERAKQLQKRLWEDMDHRHVSGVRVLRELRQHNGVESETMMPVVFTSTVGIGDETFFEADVEYGISQTPQVWLDHQVNEREGRLIYNWDAVEALFPPGLLDDMFAAWRCLLVDLASSDEAWTSNLSIPSSHRRILDEANRTGVPFEAGLLHQDWLRVSAANPNKTAVLTADECWSHGQLKRLVDSWSLVLKAYGARPNRLIAVILDKSPHQPAAVLAVLNAGAAYLPIDVQLPLARRDYLLDIGEVDVVLTSANIKSASRWPEKITVLAIDQAPPTVTEVESSIETTPEDLAYVIFTSGSTGQPKGVSISHRAALNTVRDINRRFQVTQADRVLGLSALNFDLSVYDVFGVLGVGGAVVLPKASELKDPAAWLSLMNDHGVTLWNTVPALMQMLVDYAPIHGVKSLDSLRLVMLSGDWIPLALPVQIKSLAADAQRYSLGGATEAAIWSIFEPIHKVAPHWKSIPYGKPLANQQFHVLDEHLEPRPIWTTGRLFISGEGLAAGYWRDPAKTNQSFVIHPTTGLRLYHTGDLGRYLPDGRIEFLGRDDHQVKIRGYRIELGEIEATLAKHETVREAVVTVHDDGGGAELIAFIVPRASIATKTTTTAANALPQDLGEKAAFTLSRPGLRPFSGGEVLALGPLVDEGRGQWKRRTVRSFGQSPLQWEHFKSWLQCLVAVKSLDRPLPKYAYPSPGALYPVQVYLQVKPGAVEGLPAGSYVLHPEDSRLEKLSDAHGNRSLHSRINQPVFDQAAFSLYLIVQMNAIQPVYGEHARELSLVEAGYMGQLLMERAGDWGLGLCPIGGVDVDPLVEDLQLDPSHGFLHAFLGGVPTEHSGRPLALPPGSEALDLVRRAADEPGQGDMGGVLREYLSAHLADYMVPKRYVFLEALPRTANGKTDRSALRPPDQKVKPNTGPVEARTQEEKDLADLWCEILGRETVGIHDNFFTLGGDSLSAVRLVARIAEQTGRKIGMRFLFSNPTVASVAELLKEASQRADLKRPEPKGGGEGGMGEQFLQVEKRPLLTLFSMGRLAPVDAASLMYVPLELLEEEGLDPDWIINQWMHGLPLITDVLETQHGRTAVIMLPVLSVDLYGNQDHLAGLILEGMRMASNLGAKVVSLMGLIPSATRFGETLLERLPKDPALPRLSTGHATTGAAVLLSIHQILNAAGRDAADACFGFLGLGSIGALSLRSILSTLPHPKALVLCELETRVELVDNLIQEVRETFEYQGEITVSLSQGKPGAAIYSADLIVGAVGAGGILDVDRLKPGAMIVDDSFPKFFDTRAASKRVQTKGDLLFTDGGYLRIPGGIKRISHQSDEGGMANLLTSQAMITSCVFSAIISSRYPEKLPPLLGEIQLSDCLHHFETLRGFGIEAADLIDGDAGIDADYLSSFRQRFGSGRS